MRSGRKHVLTLLFAVSLSFNVAALGVVAVGLRAHDADPATESDDARPRRDLLLSPAQEQTFDALRLTFQEERRRQEAVMITLREALLAQLISDQPDRGRIDSLLSEMAQSHALLQRSLIDRILQEAASLRGDQREVFTRLLERRLLRVSPRNGQTSQAR